MRSYESEIIERRSPERRPCRRVEGWIAGQALRKRSMAVALLAAFILTATPQGRINPRNQVRNETGTSLPPLCSVGETYLKTDAPLGKSLYACTPANTWTVQGSGPDPTGNADKVLSNDGATSGWRTMGGDVSGRPDSLTVVAVQGRPVSSAAPVTGQALVWNNAAFQWQPQNVSVGSGGSGGGVGGAFSSGFTSQTAVIIPGSAHQLGTANVLVGCYDLSIPAVRVQPNTVSVHPVTFDVTVTFVVAQSGRCVVSSGGSSSGSGSSGGGSGASMAAQLGDLQVTSTSPTVLAIGSNCSTATPCNIRWGNRVYTFVSVATVTLTAGTGVAYIYVDANGTLTVGHNLTLACAFSCTALPGTVAFPVNSIPVYTWSATAGVWDTAGGLDKRAMLSGKILSAGTGIITVDTGSNTNVSVDSAAVPTYLTSSATLNFGAIAAGACVADLTFPLRGAAPGNSVAPGWPGGLEAGLIGNMRVSAPNTIAVRLCNLSGAVVSPASGTYTGTIVRSF